jgi:beta-lactam-binding protein with PASTA domain
MRVACTVALIVALALATPVAAPAYTYPGPSQALKETVERLARESAEQAAKEKQEHEAKEKQEREAREGPPVAQPPPREQPQEAEASGSPATVRCVVPSLRDDSLGVAQKALRKAHCKLGKVSRPRTHHGALVVTGQSPKSGKKLASGAAVAVTLGSSKATRGRS